MELSFTLRPPTLSERIACRFLGHKPNPSASYSIEIRDVATGALLVNSTIGVEVDPPICSRCRREVIDPTLNPTAPRQRRWPHL